MTNVEDELALKEVFVAQFERLRAVLPELAGLRPDLEWPSLDFAAGDDPLRVAEITAREDGPPVVTVHERFLAELENEFVNAGADLRDACLSDLDELTARSLSTTVIEGLFDFAATFLLAHELHHYFGGHMAAFGPRRKQQALRYDESAFAMAPNAKEQPARSRQQLRRRYYLEHESDSTALQTLMQGALSPSVEALTAKLGPARRRVSSVFEAEDAAARLVVFRMVVAAFWTTIGLLERRTPNTIGNTTTHPLPGARVLAGLSTILEQFAEFTAVRIDANGMNLRVLTDADVLAIGTFLRQVLKPVVTARLGAMRVASRDAALESTEVGLVLELGNIFDRNRLQTPAGAELLAIQRLRPRMKSLLEEYARAFRVGRRRSTRRGRR